MGEIDLNALYEAGEAACVAAFEKKSEIGGAINWGDLHCVDAERCESIHGGVTYRIWIEECSPDNFRLMCFIQDRLKEAGFKNIEIKMEW